MVVGTYVALDSSLRSMGTFYRAGSPGQTGDERGNTDTAGSRQSVAAPATVSGEPASYGHWATGKAGRNWVTTREPGDLPAQSPNRWTGRPYGAVFRSGDINAGAKAVRGNSPTTSDK